MGSRFIIQIIILVIVFIIRSISSITQLMNTGANNTTRQSMRNNEPPEWLKNAQQERQAYRPITEAPIPIAPRRQPIDINSATEEELTTLPGINPEMARTASVIQQTGGFSSLTDFAAKLGLSPTVAMGLAAKACCKPMVPGRSPGRILDI